MPNCDFYALEEDALSVLSFILEHTPCQIYESYSTPGKELRRFTSIDALRPAFRPGACGPSLLLSLYAPTMGGAASIRRIKLDLEKFPAPPWRFEVEGWGLIQLHLRGLHDGKIFPSHTNHNSEKRALAWHSTYPRLGDPARWNWAEVTRLSRQINRFLHRVAPRKVGSRPVLAAASSSVKSEDAALAPN